MGYKSKFNKENIMKEYTNNNNNNNSNKNFNNRDSSPAGIIIL
jgi:hypothetical protein